MCCGGPPTEACFGHALSTGLLASGDKLAGPRTNGIIPLSKIRARAFSLRSVAPGCVGFRGHEERGARAADELARGDRDPRRAHGLRAGVDGHLSARAARAEPRPR